MRIATLTLLSVLLASAGFAATLNVPGNYATIQACVNAAQPGDTCFVAAGSYAGASIARSGAAGKYITLLADPSGAQPLLTGSINIGGNSYITVQGFQLSGASINTSLSGSHIKIIGNTFQNCGLKNCLDIYASHVLVDGNTFGPAGLNDDDMDIYNQYAVVRNNEAKGITETTQHPDFIQTFCVHGTTIALAFALVENNYAHDCTGADCHFFQFNNQDCDGTDIATNYIFRHNTAYNLGSLFMSTQAYSTTNRLTGMAIYNNTLGNVYRSTNQVNQFGGVGGGSIFGGFEKNDLVYQSMSTSGAMGLSFPTGFTLKNSLVYYPGHSVTATGNLSTCVSSGGCMINQDPKLTNYAGADYSLQAGSPAIDAGTSITTVASGDSGGGTSLVVNDAYAFQDGTWIDGIKADCISVRSVGNHICITAINYSTNTITLASDPGPRANGDPIYLYSDSNGNVQLQGTGPDMGAVESLYSQGTRPAPPTSLRIIR
jgi:hypothetical protein